nr:OadG-related small transporter subunit [Caproicibacter fermentans]
MGKGMAGIFVVMLLIFLVIVALNRWTKNKD